MFLRWFENYFGFNPFQGLLFSVCFLFVLFLFYLSFCSARYFKCDDYREACLKDGKTHTRCADVYYQCYKPEGGI